MNLRLYGATAVNPPLTQQELLIVAAKYNTAIFPLQILIYIPSLLIFLLLRRGTKQDTSRGVLLLLAAQWGTVGALFFLMHMVDKSPAAGWTGAAVFLAGGLYFAAMASKQYPPHFHWRNDPVSWVSGAVTLAAVLGYPLLGWVLGRSYPVSTAYGLMPGTTATFAVGVLLTARPAPRLKLLMPSLAWLPATVLCVWWWGLWEELLLAPAAGAALLVWWRLRQALSSEPTKDTIRFDF